MATRWAAFQIADDILDAEGDEAALGKRASKDAERNKATLVGLLGLDKAREAPRRPRRGGHRRSRRHRARRDDRRSRRGGALRRAAQQLSGAIVPPPPSPTAISIRGAPLLWRVVKARSRLFLSLLAGAVVGLFSPRAGGRSRARSSAGTSSRRSICCSRRSRWRARRPTPCAAARNCRTKAASSFS